VNFDELLKTLHQDYLSSLPKKIVTIRDQIMAGQAGDLRESFHKLKGTGRTYGMPEVSDLSAVVEEVCLDNPAKAATAAGHALEILQDIYTARTQGRSHDLEGDPRFLSVRKLLQN
jgi:HPt (histidine-containing phosphotransfer) domain-containing protein